MEYSVYQLLWIFLIYSVLGWCAGVAANSLRRRSFINTGFLDLPVCPVYGFGAVLCSVFLQELRDEPGGFAANLSGICGYMMDLERAGEIRREDIVDLGDVVMGKRPGRTSDQERIIFIMDGMPIEDVAWGYTVYEKAKELGLGTKLNLWG